MIRCLVLAALLPALTRAQAPPEETIRAETRAVQISVSARSKEGAHIGSLKREDFRITDNGKPREVQFFSADDAKSPPPRPQPNVGPGVFTNRFSAGSGPGRITAILLDGLNTDFEDQSHARQQALQAVDRMRGDETIAVYSLKNELAVLQTYTTDKELLRAAIKRFKPSVPMMLGKQVKNPYGAQHKKMGGDENTDPPALSEYQLRRRVASAMESLNVIADHMGGATGRKSILWVTGGFAHDEDLHNLMRGSLHRVNDANVAIYPVDARGLLPGSDAIDNIMLMQEFAAATGGRAYYNRNDIGEAIVEAMEDSSTAYSLGFYLSDKDLDGQFHNLKVSLNNRPDIELHYRKGYTAVKELKRKKDEELETELLDPVNATAIGIDAKVERKGKTLSVTMLLDGYYTNFEELFVETSVTGQIVGKQLGEAKLSELKPGMFPKFTQSIPLAKDVDKLTIIIRDHPSGRVGTLTIPFGK